MSSCLEQSLDPSPLLRYIVTVLTHLVELCGKHVFNHPKFATMQKEAPIHDCLIHSPLKHLQNSLTLCT